MAVPTDQDHVMMMGLVEEGDDNGSTIYILGRTDRFLLRWGTVSEEDKNRYRKIIHAVMMEVGVHIHTRVTQTQPEVFWTLKV